LIFLGDIAAPFGVPVRSGLGDAPGLFAAEVAVANLEGGIVATAQEAAHVAGVYNRREVVDLLTGLNVRAVSLANNHILDTGDPPSRTINVLAAQGIAACGAGDDAITAAAPAEIVHRDKRYCFLSHGWKPIGCRPATATRPGVAPLSTDTVTAAVTRCRRAHPDALIVVLAHWNYELEIYPQPAHRRLARAAIAAGASAVIGHHSHIVQGVEFHRGGLIAYGLGNWFFPQGVFFGGRLVYPAESGRQLALAWDPATGGIVCHWFSYRPVGHEIHHEFSEDARTSTSLAELTPFRGLDDEDYLRWFRTHRRKRLLLPVYDDDTRLWRNTLRDSWLDVRNWISRHRPRRKTAAKPD